MTPFVPTPEQLDRVRPWAPLIASVCGRPGAAAPDGRHQVEGIYDPYDFAAMGFRETSWCYGAGYSPQGDPLGWGDDHHGFGAVQLDVRTYGAEITRIQAISRVSRDAGVRKLFEVALNVLFFDRVFLSSAMRKRPLMGEELRITTFESYNAGPGRVAALAAHDENPDRLTAGGDYGRWTVAAAEKLRQAAPDLFSAFAGARVA